MFLFEILDKDKRTANKVNEFLKIDISPIVHHDHL